jgi:hypothetical protein
LADDPHNRSPLFEAQVRQLQIACTPLKDALIDAEMALRLMREQHDLKEKSDD